jgi:hypothetical protein
LSRSVLFAIVLSRSVLRFTDSDYTLVCSISSYKNISNIIYMCLIRMPE